MSTREDAHRLLDAVPDDQVDTVVLWLRQITESGQAQPALRRFRTVGAFTAERDLGARAKDIVRRELGGQSSKSA